MLQQLQDRSGISLSLSDGFPTMVTAYKGNAQAVDVAALYEKNNAYRKPKLVGGADPCGSEPLEWSIQRQPWRRETGRRPGTCSVLSQPLYNEPPPRTSPIGEVWGGGVYCCVPAQTGLLFNPSLLFGC